METMQWGTLIPSILFGLLGLWILVYVLKTLVGSILNQIGVRLPKFALRPKGFTAVSRKARVLDKIDQHLASKELDAAIKLLPTTFVLEHVSKSRDAVQQVGRHNLAVFSRILTISEQGRGPIANIAVVEELFQTRTGLMDDYIRTQNVKQNLRKRQEEKERDIPNWTANEYKAKLSELREQIATNRQALITQLDKLFDELEQTRPPTDVLYH